jgi:5-methylcytosine-specific restriction enzyme A
MHRRLRYPIREAREQIGIGNTKFWALVKSGHIEVHYDGNKGRAARSTILLKAQWRRLREQVLRVQPPCVLCLQRGLAVPSEQVDHIQPIADGGEPWAFSNLRGLCAPCHSICTNAAKTGRDVVIGVDPTTGYPIKAT